MFDNALLDWSRLQFAMTAMYHWLFVPLTLGLGVIMALAEQKYYRTGDDFWKETAKFWQKIFGINFATGIATGLILEFQFGTNWSNYSYFVGDIFGAPLAIEGILAFFMEATFFAVMFFGWDKVSRRFHLTSTWLTIIGATLSAWWILVANGWMQHPAGMHFNPETTRNEMIDFFAVALNPVAVVKFFHTVISSWILGAIVVMGICGWYLLRGKRKRFAVESIKIAARFGILASIITMLTGHMSGTHVAKYQPMKLAAMENLYDGGYNQGLSIIGMVNSSKSIDNDEKAAYFDIAMPGFLSFMATNDFNGYVPGINDIIKTGYTAHDGTVVPSAEERMAKGKIAINALSDFQAAKRAGDEALAEVHKKTLNDNFDHFGYGYFDNPKDLIPNVPLTYYSFRIMVGLSFFFLIVFIVALLWAKGDGAKLIRSRGFHRVLMISIPLVYICSQAGWIVAEVGRQPWTIQDILPVQAAISDLSAGSVIVTFVLFLVLFTAMLIAELSIMKNAVKKGPNLDEHNDSIVK